MILVTGGAGFIGAHTVRALAEAGQECVLLQRRAPIVTASTIGVYSRGNVGALTEDMPLSLGYTHAIPAFSYGLLAHHDGHPVTGVAVYAVRYQRLLRFSIEPLLSRLAGRPLDMGASSATLAELIRDSRPERLA